MSHEPFEPLFELRRRIKGRRRADEHDRPQTLAAALRLHLDRGSASRPNGSRRPADLGLTYADTVSSFRGTLTTLPPLPSGRAYAQVVDQRGGRVTVVPVSGDVRRLQGRDVEVTVDAVGRSSLRAGPSHDRGEDRS